MSNTGNHATRGDVAHVVVVSGGQLIQSGALAMVPPDALVVAADSGWDRAIELGIRPHVLVGDMDSISPSSLRDAEDSGVTIVRHPVDKDFTDLELALAYATSRSFRITVLSGGGGRLDHAFAEITTLTSPQLRACTVDAIVGTARVHVAHEESPLTLALDAGTVVSLAAIGAGAIGVSLTGCKWNLADESLSPYESRGLSNVVTTTPMSLTVTAGHIAVIEPFFITETR